LQPVVRSYTNLRAGEILQLGPCLGGNGTISINDLGIQGEQEMESLYATYPVHLKVAFFSQDILESLS
jgi:hypothetical protein